MINTRGGGDSPFLLWRVHQLAANLRDGVFPARWMPDAAYGLGYPFFSYYAALPYYVASLFHLAGLDILTAIKLTQTLGFLLAAAASYGWFRRVFQSQAAAWLGAAAFTFAPFHLVNVYVRGDSLSEFYAFIFYPLILWAIDNAICARTPTGVITLGLTYGGLVVTHTLSAAIFSPFVLLYAIVQILNPQSPISNPQYQISNTTPSPPNRRLPVTFCRLFAGLALGLALSAWYWLPALMETRYVQPGTLQEGYFHYSGHFRTGALGKEIGLVQLSPGFVYDTTSEQTSPFAMGLVQAIVAALGIILNLKSLISNTQSPPSTLHPPPSNHTSLALFLFLLATFMMTPLSRPLWDHLPLLPMVQFPWRFLSVQALFAAMMAAWGVEHLRVRGAAAAVVASALALAVMLPLRPERLMIAAGDVTTGRLQMYELFTANIGTTITYEWLPRDVNPRPYTSEQVTTPGAPPRAFAIEGELVSARETAHRSTRRAWQIDAATPATLVFPLLYWPGWSAALDGAPIPIRAAHSSGRVQVDVPPGQHTIVLQLGNTPLRLAAQAISLLALLICGAFAASRLTIRVPRFTLHASYLAPLVLALIALTLMIVASQPPSRGAPAETMDFVQMPYLHTGGAYFQANTPGAYNLLNSYRINPEQVSVGQAISLTMNWTVVESPLTATISLVGLSEHLPDLRAPILLDQSSAPLDEMHTASSHALNIPPDLPPGAYLIQVRLVGASGERPACTANGTEMGQVYLRPIYVQGNSPLGAKPSIAVFGDRLHLHAVRAGQQTPTQLLVKLDWSASQAIAENYGIAVRLYDAQGERWAAIDTQPGYGFLPTVAWRPGQTITDRLILPLPEGLPPRDDYELEIILYDLANDLAGIGQYVQPGIALTQYARRAADSSMLARLTPQLALASIDLPVAHAQGARVLRFDAGWLATAHPVNTLARWSLVDEAGSAVATHTVTLDAAAWPAGAFVLDAVRMPVPARLSAGRYRLAVALLDAQSEVELGQARLEQEIGFTGHPRRFELPPLDSLVGASLGEMIRLEGYTLEQDQDALRLALVWRAQQAMPTDYTVFVHLVNAQDAIAAQYDAMPQGNTYPTSWWVAGEVVTDNITLSLKDAPPGAYRLAVGMYDSAAQTRLEALGPENQHLPGDRVILPSEIRWP